MTNKSNSKLPTEQMSRASKIVVFIAALFCSFLLWIYAIGYDSTLFERTFNGIPVEIQGEELLADSKNFMLAPGQKFSSITVVVKGKRSELNELSAQDFRAVVDVSLAEGSGEQQFNIVVYAPNGIEVISQSSMTVRAYVDNFTQKSQLLSVSVDIGNEYLMSEGVTFVDTIANPAAITVSGPASVLDRIEGAYVDFDLEDYPVKDTIYSYGAIELRDKNGNVINDPYVKISDNTAYVTVNVTKQKTVPVDIMFVGGIFENSGEDYPISYISSHSSVSVSGSPSALDAITSVVLEIDETTVNGKQSFEFPIGSMLPEGVSNNSGTSKIVVDVTMPSEFYTREYSIAPENITIENLPEGYEYTVSQGINVTLIGPAEAFEFFDPAMLKASADYRVLKDNMDGTYTAKAKISFGLEHSAIYVLNLGYTVDFTVNEIIPDVLPGEGEDSPMENDLNTAQ